MRSEANNNALSKLSYIAINTINQICVIVRAGTNTPSDEYDTYREYRVANTIRIANTLFSEAKLGNG